MQKTVAVTGANGFIGKHICDRLFSEGYKVAKIPHESLLDYAEVEKILKEIKPDYIYHLSAYGNHSTQQDESQCLISNILSLFFILKANIEIKAQIINFSTSSVYGNKKKAMKETDSLETTTFYGCTKASAELICRAFESKYEMKIVNIRPFSVYGEGEAEHRFIPTVINKILKQESLLLDPTPVHDWIYIQDFIDGVMLVKDKTGTFNIGTGVQHTNKEVYEIIKGILKSDTKIEKIDNSRKDQPKVWRANINKISKLGFKPKKTLEWGLWEVVPTYIVKYANSIE